MPMGMATSLLGDWAPYNFVAWAKYHVAYTQFHDSVRHLQRPASSED
jgi:hypothetical protein